MKSFKFDPRIFIRPPYIKCPKCGKDSFGILTIGAHQYYRRCKECFYPKGNEPSESYPLPELKKRIIYLDQFALSNIMKADNPNIKAYKKGRLDNFWFTLSEKITRLRRLQLIVCPRSNIQIRESLVSPYFDALKQMYEKLGHGLSFQDFEVIKARQILKNARNWVLGCEQKESLQRDDAISGEVNAWQERYFISVNINYDPAWIDNLRKVRRKINKELSVVAKHWQSETDKSFDYWFDIEVRAFSKACLITYCNYFKELDDLQKGRSKLSEKHAFPPASVSLIHALHNTFKEVGVQEFDLWPKTFEYFASSAIRNVPFNRIAAMLYAALARKFASGRKKPPNQGIGHDIEVISVLLPYCDAMFIDNECHSYLKENPISETLNYGTKIFSLNDRAAFIEYLNEIEATTPRTHFDKIDEVYGKKWRE